MLSAALSLAACSQGAASSNESESAASTAAAAETSAEAAESSEAASAEPGSQTLIAYFSWSGNTERVASLIQQETGGDLFEIAPATPYTDDYDALLDQAQAEQAEDARPELAAQVENWQDYDVVFVGYPNWWGDLPMPLYTFLEETDLSGKTIIPFCPHGGSGFSRTEETIAELQPEAQVSEDGFTISRNDVADCEEEVVNWVNGLGL